MPLERSPGAFGRWLLGCTYSELVHAQLSKRNSFLKLKFENKKEIEKVPYPLLLEASDAHAISLAGSGVTDRCVEVFQVLFYFNFFSIIFILLFKSTLLLPSARNSADVRTRSARCMRWGVRTLRALGCTYTACAGVYVHRVTPHSLGCTYTAGRCWTGTCPICPFSGL